MAVEDLWRLFDIIGTLAFAVSGALVGIAHRRRKLKFRG